jgi:hypothetical protein
VTGGKHEAMKRLKPIFIGFYEFDRKSEAGVHDLFVPDLFVPKGP